MRCDWMATGAVLAGVFLAGEARAAFDSTMYDVGLNLSDFATLEASQALDDTSYEFNVPSGFSSSGHTIEVGPTVVDRTRVDTDVFRVNQQQVISQGANSLTLDPGDRVYAYTIELVDASSTTVQRLKEFQLFGFDESLIGGPPGADFDNMDPSLLKGRGFLTPASGVSTPVSFGPNDLFDFGGGSNVDWDWPDGESNQLANSETITLLLFAKPSIVGNGFADLISPVLQDSSVFPEADFVPVLVPVVPGPGALATLAVGGLLALKRRR